MEIIKTFKFNFNLSKDSQNKYCLYGKKYTIDELKEILNDHDIYDLISLDKKAFNTCKEYLEIKD